MSGRTILNLKKFLKIRGAVEIFQITERYSSLDVAILGVC